jgi:hypothetical protein
MIRKKNSTHDYWEIAPTDNLRVFSARVAVATLVIERQNYLVIKKQVLPGVLR